MKSNMYQPIQLQNTTTPSVKNSTLKPHAKITLIVAVLALTLAGTPARVDAASSVVISSATANLVTNQITITGVNFGSTVPSVKLNTMPLTVTSNHVYEHRGDDPSYASCLRTFFQ